MTVLVGKLSKKQFMVAEDTVRVMQSLLRDGGDARFVGGCVRDALANRRIIDIDIATPLKPEEVTARLEADKIHVVPTGLKHGTVTAVVEGRPFEITTLRHDVVAYGRHADVAFTDDWKADAARRDFTINAMSATIDGDVYDYFSGMEDLRNGQIVFVGDAEKRVQEDILRILRYFRFYAHFGKGEPQTAALAACSKLADHLPRLSAERIRNEILKLLEAQNCPAVWQLMAQNRVVTHFLPEATNVRALERLVKLEEKYHSPGYVMRRLLAVLDVTVGGLMKVIESLRLSKEQGGHLLTLFEPGVAVDNKMDQAAVNRAVYQLGNDVVRSLLLLTAAREGKDHNLADTFQWATAFRPPRFPLIGQDVLDLGYAQGPDIGRILGDMESWWLAENFEPGRSACLQKLQDDYARI